jgi:hypothetical protein
MTVQQLLDAPHHVAQCGAAVSCHGWSRESVSRLGEGQTNCGCLAFSQRVQNCYTGGKTTYL